MPCPPRRFLFTSMLLALIALPAAAADQPDLPSPADIQKLVDSGQYRDALKVVTRVLAITGPPAAAYDRYDLFMARAESELQVRQPTTAIEALNAAKKEAFAQEKPERAVAPVALSFLLQHSIAYQYAPEIGGNHKPIPWLDRTRRNEAYAALLADELPTVQKKIPMLDTVKTIPPLLDAARAIGPLHALELSCGDANTAAPSQTQPLVTTVADKAGHLIDDAVIDPSGKVSNISGIANQLVTMDVANYDPNTKRSYVTQVTRRRGLTPDDAQYLQRTGALSAKFVAAATEISQLLITDSDALKEAIANASTLKLRIAALLNDDYNDPTDHSQKTSATQPK